MLDRLVTEKLTAEAEMIAKEGWKWISVAFDFPYGHASGLRALEGKPADLTAEEQATIDALNAEQAGWKSTIRTPTNCRTISSEVFARSRRR